MADHPAGPRPGRSTAAKDPLILRPGYCHRLRGGSADGWEWALLGKVFPRQAEVTTIADWVAGLPLSAGQPPLP